ncbi:MAG TPA: radical SAM protein [Candidatus Nanoarchaeia archaeon]|nr:radical SAM protein [Candidatus Nanoarchaeia archaeon]
MNILFINPPLQNLIQAETPKFVTTDRGYNPPMGLIWLATCINAWTSHKALVLDTQVEGMSYEDVKRKVREINPDVVGMAALTFTLLDSLNLAKAIKEINPCIKIVFGGPHATMFPNETIRQPNVDIVVAGEGEKTFTELIENLHSDEKLRQVSGIYFKNKEGRVIVTPPKPFIQNLDELPMPDRTLTPYKKYYSVLSKANPLTTMVTSRGCPYLCTFCDRPQAGGKTFRARSAKLVVDEMESCKQLGINEILFYDDTWTLNRRRAKEICDEILSRKLEIIWDCRTRVDSVDEELLKLMKKAGCERINFGVESGTVKGLQTVKKGVTIPQIEKAFRLCKEVGMDRLGYFILGLPGETKEEMLETIRFAKKLKPSFCHFTVFTPFPETEVWRDLLSQGNTSVMEAWKKYAENPTTAFDPPTCGLYPKEELFKMCEHAYKSFYFRPRYIWQEVLKVRSVGEFTRKAAAGMKILLSPS